MTKHILVIEDDTAIREALETALGFYDFEVSGIEGTTNIMETVRRHGPDLVLTDYQLPGMNGGQICKLIKTNEQTRHIPVILMSAYHKSTIDLANFRYDAYVPKPFDMNKLVDTIQQLLN